MRSRGGCGRALELRVAREGPLGTATTANRTRESRPSGMRGGLVETWPTADAEQFSWKPKGGERPTAPPTGARATLLPDKALVGRSRVDS